MDESKQILTALARLEENVKNMNAKIDGFSKVSELALQTEQSAKSAHNRIDDLKADYEIKLKDQKEDYEEKIRDQKDDLQELKSNITWLWRTVTGGILSLVFGLILYFLTK